MTKVLVAMKVMIPLLLSMAIGACSIDPADAAAPASAVASAEGKAPIATKMHTYSPFLGLSSDGAQTIWRSTTPGVAGVEGAPFNAEFPVALESNFAQGGTRITTWRIWVRDAVGAPMCAQLIKTDSAGAYHAIGSDACSAGRGEGAILAVGGLMEAIGDLNYEIRVTQSTGSGGVTGYTVDTTN